MKSEFNQRRELKTMCKDTCRWVKHIDEGCYTADCGWVQGIRVRPKQKICHCGRRIERINLNTVSAPMQELKDSLGIR